MEIILLESIIIMFILSVSLISMRVGNAAKSFKFWKILIFNAMKSYLMLPMIIFGFTISINISGKANVISTLAFVIILMFWFFANKINISSLLFFISGTITVVYYWTFIYGILINNKINDFSKTFSLIIFCFMTCIFSVFFISEIVNSISKKIDYKKKLSLKRITPEVIFKAITAALPTVTGIINLLKALKVLK